MPKAVVKFVRTVDAVNKVVGTFSMYLVFMMIAILLYEPIARNLFGKSSIWAVEMAQFTMAAYYLLGGGFSMILKGHVRMDLLYGRWSDRKKAIWDVFTGLFLIFYLVFLLYGAYSSIEYAVMYGQRNRSAWAQYSIRHPRREKIIQALKSEGIPTAIYYPIPLHLQGAFENLGYQTGDFPLSEEVSKEIFSLPMHPYLESEDQDRIIDCIKRNT